MIIAVSGMDGTGKTTSSKFITNLLEEKDCDTKLLHITSKYLSPTNYLISRYIKNDIKKSNIRRSYKKIRESKKLNLLNFFRPLFLLFDMYLVFFLFILPLKIENKIIICDRCFYDNLVDLKVKKVISKRTFNCLLKITPKPNLTFLLMCPYKISYDRDRDLDLKTHKAKSELYLRHKLLFDYIINTNRSIDIVQKEIKFILEKRFKNE